MTKQEFLNKAQGLVAKYQPTSEVVGQIKNVELVIVVGPSGVGKSILIKKSGIQLVPSDTTRSARSGEVDGQDMIFRSDYQQILSELNNGDFVQTAIGSGGDFYATRASSYPKSGLAAMPVMSDVVPIFRNLGFKKTTTIFIVPPSFEEWMRRMGSHDLAKEQLSKRLSEAKTSFEFALNDQQILFIFNDNLDEALKQILELLKGKIDKPRESKAKEQAQKIYAQLIKSI